MDGRTDGLMDEGTDRQTDGSTDGRSDRRMVGWTDGWTVGRTDGRTDDWTEGRTDGRTEGGQTRNKEPLFNRNICSIASRPKKWESNVIDPSYLPNLMNWYKPFSGPRLCYC